MDKEKNHIDYDLMARYLANEASDGERQELEKWTASSKENRNVFQDCKKLFSLEYTGPGKTKSQFDKSMAWEKVYNRLNLQSDIDEKIIELKPEQEPHKKQIFPIWIRIAAILVIGLTIVFYLLIPDTKDYMVQNTQGINEIYLPDSTRVVLKNISSLTYNSDYVSKNRDVELTGTAYFDVVVNKEIPFTISTAEGTIEVLGTSFLIQETSDGMEVTVEKGQVKFSSNKNPDITAVLTRNQKAILLSNEQQINTIPNINLNFLYWATNTLTYKQSELKDVFNELRQLFNITINYSSEEIKNCRITGVFRNESVQDIIANLALSLGFEYTIDGNIVEINADGCPEN